MPDASEPRRSQRERKKATQFVSGTTPNFGPLPRRRLTALPVNSSLLSKRKRSDATSDEENGKEGARNEDSDHGSADDEDDAEEGDYHAPKPPAKSSAKRKTKVAPAPKKPRAPRGTAPKRATQKPPGPSKPRKSAGRKGKQAAGADGEFDGEKVAKDIKISNDNPLFSTLYAYMLPFTRS